MTMAIAPLVQLGESPREFLKKYRTEVAASTSSIFATTAAFPLDSIKTRMQTYRYPSVLECAKTTYKQEKLGGFFRGLAAPVMSVTIVRTLSFSLYSRIKRFYSSACERVCGYDVLKYSAQSNVYPNFWTVACFGMSGATAGAVVSFISCPFELTKLSAQISVLLATKAQQTGDPKQKLLAESYKNKGTIKTMAHIVRNRGITGLYTGFKLHLIRDTVGTSVYFIVYETGKQIANGLFGGKNPNASRGSDSNSNSHEGGGMQNQLAVATAGGLCGVMSWAVIYPVDVVKSIYQRNSLTSPRGEAVPPAPKVEFFKKNMYRGLGVSMTRSAVVNAVFFTIFEKIKKEIDMEL